MKNFIEIDIQEFTVNPFQMIGKEWMLITAEAEGKVNTMTASWGGMGVLWGQNVVFIFVRKSRYTKEFIDASDSFSVSFYDNSYRKELGYFGKISGRDENKIDKVGFTVVHEATTPYFEEAKTVLICNKLSKHEIAPNGFIDNTIIPKWYSDNDYHDMYIGAINKVLVQE